MHRNNDSWEKSTRTLSSQSRPLPSMSHCRALGHQCSIQSIRTPKGSLIIHSDRAKQLIIGIVRQRSLWPFVLSCLRSPRAVSHSIQGKYRLLFASILHALTQSHTLCRRISTRTFTPPDRHLNPSRPRRKYATEARPSLATSSVLQHPKRPKRS